MMLPLLPLILIIPIIGSLILLIIDRKEFLNGDPSLIKNNEIRLKQVALSTSLINFFVSLFIWFNFDSNISQYQFVLEFNHLGLFDFNFGIDAISLYFVLLTTFITPIALLSNYSNLLGKEAENIKFFLISILLLESLQICAFVSLDLILFYIFFESVLPVLFILIVVFGHGEDRLRSAFLFFLYTLSGSLPMLLSILLIYSYLGTTDFNLISEIDFDIQKILFLGFFIAFAVKTPMTPFIIWLPKAHADSVLSGSIILAGTILKLATYGYLRIILNMLPEAATYFSPMVQTIAIISLVYSSFATIVQQDTKRLIAYSSIALYGPIYLYKFININILKQTLCRKFSEL